MTNAQYVRQFMERHHLSRHMLASQLGCAPSLIARIERGMEPSREWMAKFQYIERLYDQERSTQINSDATCQEVTQLLDTAELLKEAEEEEQPVFNDEEIGEEDSKIQGFSFLEPDPEEQELRENPGQALHRLRMEYGLSLSEAADILGVGKGELADAEKGQTTAEKTTELIQRLVDVFELYE